MSYNGNQLETPTPSALTLGGDFLKSPHAQVTTSMSKSNRLTPALHDFLSRSNAAQLRLAYDAWVARQIVGGDA